MHTRRDFLGAIAMPSVAAAAPGFDPVRAAEALLARPAAAAVPGAAASDEDFWFEIARAFAVDRSIVNLNNGGVCPAPSVAQDSLKRYLDHANTAPSYVLWRLQEPQKEGVRKRLGKLFGCDPEELAITRNASEGLQICQFGIDLEPGDEVVSTNQDYPRMVQSFEQRAAREGIVYRQISIPVPATDPERVVELYEAAITKRTKLLLVSHMVNLTGQILPVADIVAMARRHGVRVIIDGAHALAHFAFSLTELDCDYYATSLHKWLFAPVGTGLLYVRRERIGELWPLMAAQESMREDIRKFEQIGTHPEGYALSVGDAAAFHEALGSERKQARLEYLRDRWARRLAEHDRFRLHTSLEPGFSCGIATFEIEGLAPADLQRWLWSKHKIYTTTIHHKEFRGIRVSPCVYTLPDEVDRFAAAVEHALAHGIGG